jgi:glycosidase
MAERLASIKQLNFDPKGKVFPSPGDWRDQVLYQLLVDRFDDGGEHPAYKPDTKERERDRNEGGKFQGGKLKGITRRLDYIKGLGCTAIWISPPFKQRQDDEGSYHGYAIQDFLAIDPRFGTTEDLQELVKEAHRRRMYVIVDIVLNHTADIFRYTQDDAPYRKEGRYEFKEWHKISQSTDLTEDDAIWPVELQNPDAFKRKGSIRDIARADPDEAVNGDFFSLKELELRKPEVMDAMIQCYKHWIAIADVDGFRIDTVRNIEPGPMAVFCNAIHEYTERIGKMNFIIFGEIVGNDDLLHKYIGQNTPVKEDEEEYPLFDAALDFPLYAVLDEVLKGTRPCVDLNNRYTWLRKYYREMGEAGKYYVTFVDNHDQGHRPFRRFLNGVNDDRLGVLGIGFLLVNLGIPCIYYGTEQGFNGGGDSDVYVRETMFGGKWGAFDTQGVHFFNEKHSIYQGIARVAKVRAGEPALRYGRQYFREISGNGKDFGLPGESTCMLAMSRILDTTEILVAANLTMQERADYVMVDAKLTSPGRKMRDLLNGERMLEVEKSPMGMAMVRVPLQGRQLSILKAE